MSTRNPKVATHSADFEVPAGFLSFDLIFSADFTGTVGGVAYSGATDAVQTFDGKGDVLGGLKVVVTTGSVRVAAL
jgi:hypothetical protein